MQHCLRILDGLTFKECYKLLILNFIKKNNYIDVDQKQTPFNFVELIAINSSLLKNLSILLKSLFCLFFIGKTEEDWIKLLELLNQFPIFINALTQSWSSFA